MSICKDTEWDILKWNNPKLYTQSAMEEVSVNSTLRGWKIYLIGPNTHLFPSLITLSWYTDTPISHNVKFYQSK